MRARDKLSFLKTGFRTFCLSSKCKRCLIKMPTRIWRSDKLAFKHVSLVFCHNIYTNRYLSAVKISHKVRLLKYLSDVVLINILNVRRVVKNIRALEKLMFSYLNIKTGDRFCCTNGCKNSLALGVVFENGSFMVVYKSVICCTKSLFSLNANIPLIFQHLWFV